MLPTARGSQMKFSKMGLEDYITNPAAEVHGIEYRINEDISFILRRAGGRNTEYERCLARYSRPHLHRIRRNLLSNDEFKRLILMPTFLDSIITDWRGISDDKGREVPFSRAACKEFLEEFPNIFEELIAVVTEVSSFKERTKEEIAESLGES